MGQHEIPTVQNDVARRTFVRAVLEDVHALERMLAEGLFENAERTIGAEQEVFLVDGSFRPSNAALALMERLAGGDYTNELGLFNLEINLPPLSLGGDCLSRMEADLSERLEKLRGAAAEEGVRVLLCGILPTLAKEHLGLDSMMPNPRYYQLNRTMCDLRGGVFRTLIKGLDELSTTHDNVMLEACNTSFQVHFQVGGREFARLYNLAQAVTAPVLAAAVNSPLLLQHRLWMETRVALFQQSIDVRSEAKTQRGTRQRVSFGDAWVRDSVMEIYREDVARFRSLIVTETGESPMAVLDRGEIPALRALCLHNGTVYRWNRPCYGTQGPHLRIENRVLPAGPTVVDQVANAAFFFGLMCALGEEYGDITQVMAFDDAKANFMAAARYGLDARLRWVEGRTHGADQLILQHLLPLARQGLRQRGLLADDVDHYLGVLQARVESGRTGAQWTLDSLAALGDAGRSADRYRRLTATMYARQWSGAPVHAWALASPDEQATERDAYRTVGQIMTTDLFTVDPEDVVDLAASLMDWEHIRHVPVEDNQGNLVGLVSHRRLLRMMARGAHEDAAPVAVREIMKTDPVTVSPETSCLDAMRLMREKKVGCLPVVRDGRLVGMVTEHDFIEVSARLLERWLTEEA